MNKAFLLALVALVVSASGCVPDPLDGLDFACDPDWKSLGLKDPCGAGCACVPLPGKSVAGYCVCGSMPDTGASDAAADVQSPDPGRNDAVGTDVAAGDDISPEVVLDVPVDGCEPRCEGKACGDLDGCGGRCTGCPDNATCNTGTWECDCPGPWCETTCCGAGQDCGTGATCVGTCTPSCTGKECGPNGCPGGGICGTCAAAEACTETTCDASGQCVHPVKPGWCLVEGTCVEAGQARTGDPCQVCNPSQGTTTWSSAVDGTVCVPGFCAGLTWTADRTCASGQCTAGGDVLSCDDGNDCTTDACDPEKGACTHEAVADGTGCGTQDQCRLGMCVDCVGDDGCADLEDDGAECTVAACNTTTFYCIHDAAPTLGNPCDDGNACTREDSCDAIGGCAGTPYECAVPGPCEVADGATCNGDGTCTYLPDTGTSCDDLDPCTSADACQEDSACRGKAYTCDTPGSCETSGGATCNGDGTCTYPVATGSTCDDGDDCTRADTCAEDRSCAGTPFSCSGHGLCNGSGCTCGDGFDGDACDRCADGFWNYPQCVRIVDVAAGGFHSCAILSDGAVRCWGRNTSGELGDGTKTTRRYPITVGGLEPGVKAIAAGVWHTCALLKTGGVRCWGSNSKGQLGNNSTTESSVPVDVPGIVGARKLAAGHEHTCALIDSGEVMCWGMNFFGQLGNGNHTDSLVPIQVKGLAGVADIATGSYHSCAVLQSGAVKCWGNNNSGELGNGTTATSWSPIDVMGVDSGAQRVVAGYGHTCALMEGGSVKCWGYNENGELGASGIDTCLGSPCSTEPLDIAGLTGGVAEITAGYNHTCARLKTGDMKCWGLNDSGQVGDGTSNSRATPTTVSGGLASASKLVAGSNHNCALLSNGAVACWGDGLGAGAAAASICRDDPCTFLPITVPGIFGGVGAVVSGDMHSCAVSDAGAVRCWGFNGNGELGNGNTTSNPTPVEVTGLAAGVVMVAAGVSHTCAVMATGAAKCWGSNQEGQLGDGTKTNQNTPVDVKGLTSGVTFIAAGTFHTCAVLTTGAVKCWGNNMSGQLGNNTTTSSVTPVDVSGLASGVTSVAAGGLHTCARLETGAAKCWGYNFSGQLGNGDKEDKLVPVAVSGLSSGVAELATSTVDHYTCARLYSGAVKCWGANDFGQLGDGTLNEHITPNPVTGLTSGVVDVTVFMSHSCALLSSGEIRCWGRNSKGEIGDGSTTIRKSPVAVTGLAAPATSVAAGYFHTCASLASGGAQCWGNASIGQLGDGTSGSGNIKTTPVMVAW